MGTFSDTDRTVVRIQHTRSDGRTAEDVLRAEIRAWAAGTGNPAYWEAWGLEDRGLAPLDGPAADEAQPTPEPEPEPEADPIEHGTTRGARRHRERDEDLCDLCWGAVRAADRRYKAKAREWKPAAS